MSKDEQEIRRLVATWFAATKAGDTNVVMDLMADDVVFLRPGEPVMNKEGFLKVARQQATQKLKIEGSSEIRELRVFDAWAYMWSTITVTVNPSGTSQPIKRSGDTFTIFHKQNDKWLLARDANMLVPVSDN